MTGGLFQFFGEDGALWADETMITHFCRTTGSGTTTTSIAPTSSSTAYVPVSGYTQPVVAIVLSGGYAAAQYRTFNLSGVTNISFVTNAPTGTAFTYYIFDYAPAIGTPTGMIQGKAEDGTLTFDSAHWAMKGLGFIPMDVDVDPVELTISGRALAVCCGTPGGHYFIESAFCWPAGTEPNPDTPMSGCPRVWTTVNAKMYGGKITNSGQTITSVKVSHSDTEGSIGNEAAYNTFISNGNGFRAPSKIMVVDVTGIPLNTTFF